MESHISVIFLDLDGEYLDVLQSQVHSFYMYISRASGWALVLKVSQLLLIYGTQAIWFRVPKVSWEFLTIIKFKQI